MTPAERVLRAGRVLAKAVRDHIKQINAIGSADFDGIEDALKGYDHQVRKAKAARKLQRRERLKK